MRVSVAGSYFHNENSPSFIEKRTMGSFFKIVAVGLESMQLSNHAIELLDATDGVAFHTIVGVASNEF